MVDHELFNFNHENKNKFNGINLFRYVTYKVF